MKKSLSALISLVLVLAVTSANAKSVGGCGGCLEKTPTVNIQSSFTGN
ncbi:hypothetical protein ACFP9V_08850 [Deinococcus radiopugnans]|uniref:Uncharacterized protein n=1 Tax=Deinococcus radiopugnans ATCC 19172 TaxID=585398 RepID=A0ABR6NQT9_9DEIO|nr:hypothetical protein [Deinococcus radiopugnans]MBB6016401.1 hypothetical protein [Deinococcus radiopugnans ATCC 19172]QLG09367.1 hypothetical protein HLB42_00230 [Deinococcus sp. D7000]